jgi:hypothetical protein
MGSSWCEEPDLLHSAFGFRYYKAARLHNKDDSARLAGVWSRFAAEASCGASGSGSRCLVTQVAVIR